MLYEVITYVPVPRSPITEPSDHARIRIVIAGSINFEPFTKRFAISFAGIAFDTIKYNEVNTKVTKPPQKRPQDASILKNDSIIPAPVKRPPEIINAKIIAKMRASYNFV